MALLEIVKTLALILLWLGLAALDCFGQAVVVSGTLASASLGGSTTNAPAGDSCGVNHLLFSWHGENADVTAGTPAGCSAGDTTGTANSGAVISTDQHQDGASSISIPTTGDYYAFDWSSSDILNPSAGTLDFWVYVTTLTGANLFYFWVDIDNRIYLTFDTGGYVGMSHNAGGTGSLARTTFPIISTNTWYHVKARWDTAAHSGLYCKITLDTTTGESNSADNGTSALGTFSGTTGAMNFGDYGGATARACSF